MFPLFELSRLLSFGPDLKANSDVAPQVALCAWREVGERSFLALLFSNGKFKEDEPLPLNSKTSM